MGGIRKKSSKRGTTFQASKIKKKAAETRKKNTRGQKKDVTWKSKKPTKDPGIPNNFPYKDKVLAEIAEQKRAAEEDRLAKKTAAKLAAKEPPHPDSDEEEGGINPGIMSLLNRTAVNIKSVFTNGKGSASKADLEGEEKEGSPAPELVDHLLNNTQAALDRADVVVEVLDARDPSSFRSSFLEDAVLTTSPFDDLPSTSTSSTTTKWQKNKLIILLNKSDLTPRESTSAWLLSLRSNPIFASGIANGSVKVLPFKSSIMVEKPMEAGGNGMRGGVPVGREGVLSVLKVWREEKERAGGEEAEEGLSVVFVGLPNVGKSSVINTLLGKPLLTTAPITPTSSGAMSTTTTSATEIALPTSAFHSSSTSTPTGISLIDTPGLEYNDPDLSDDEFDDEEEEVDDDEEDEDEEMREMDDEEIQSKQERWDILERLAAKDMLARNMGRVDKVKDSYPLVKQIVSRANAQDLMMAYNVPAFIAGDLAAFLTELARANGRVKKHGVPDIDSAAKILLRDWALGLFPHYSMPSKSEAAPKDLRLSEEDEKVLSALPLKSTLRKIGKGIIKLTAGEVDGRELILDEDYEIPGEEDEDDEEMGGFGGEDDDDEDDDEEEDEPVMWDGEGEEVELVDDEEPSESDDGDDEDELEEEDSEEEEEEEEEAPPPPPTTGNKRKRLSVGSVKEPESKKARKVMFAAKPKGPAEKAEFEEKKALPSSILKRKGRGDDDDDDEEERVAPKGKKAKGEVTERVIKEVKSLPAAKKEKVEKVKPVKVAEKVKPVREVKAARTKEAKVKVIPAAVPTAKPTSKATQNVPTGEKPYDFGAHFF